MAEALLHANRLAMASSLAARTVASSSSAARRSLTAELAVAGGVKSVGACPVQACGGVGSAPSPPVPSLGGGGTACALACSGTGGELGEIGGRQSLLTNQAASKPTATDRTAAYGALPGAQQHQHSARWQPSALGLPRHSLACTRGFAAKAAQPDEDIGIARIALEHASAFEGTSSKDVLARQLMSDPMTRLMASQGMPMALSLDSDDGAASSGAAAGSSSSSSSSSSGAAGSGAGGADDDSDDDEGIITTTVSSSSGDSSGGTGISQPPPPEPDYNMEAFSDMLRATAVAARPGGAGVGGLEAAAANAAAAAAAGAKGSSFGVQQVGPSLEDSWGTTRETAVDIARRIADSNADLDGPSVTGSPDDDDDGPEEALALSAAEAKYASLEAMSADIKKLDEVWEVLASVPWLDEDNLQEKELKGVAMVGLLGTLEEVGFSIRQQVCRVWAGEQDAELAQSPGLEAREQAALIAILYHTKQLQDKYGPPPKGFIPDKKQ